MFATALLISVAAQAPAIPPPSPTRPFRISVVECAASGGSGLHPAPVRDLFTQGLLASGVVELVGGVAGVQGAAPVVTDVEGLARAGRAASADKVLCAVVDPQGAMPVLFAQLVDVSSTRLEWSRVAPTDGTEPGVRDVVGRQATELSAFLVQMSQLRPALTATPPPPPVAAAPVVEVTPSEPAAKRGFLTWNRGAGIALASVGAALIPTALAVVLMAGAGHLSPGANGPPQLVLLLPEQPKPRFYSPVFTLTWADVATTGVLWTGAAVLIVAGVLLAVWPV